MILGVLFLSLSVWSLCTGNEVQTEVDLHEKLFKFYNPDVMPVSNKSEPIEVSVELFIWNIDNIDEKSQTFTIRAFLENKWKNSFLTWNPANYSGIKTINVQNNNVWLPDLALQNVYDSPTELGQRDGRTNVDYTGVCSTWPYKLFQVGCKITVRKFPFDVQMCELDFLSWTNPNSVLKLRAPEKLSFGYYKESVEWSLESYNITLYQNPYGDDFWDHVVFRFTLRRKWLFQVINIIAPILCISLLNPTCFIIPADCGEKITLCLTIFLSLAVFLTLVNDSLPESSDEVSLFSIYVGLQLVCSGLTIIAVVISLHLYYKDQSDPVSFYYRLLSRAFCKSDASRYSDTSMDNNGHHLMDEPSLKETTTCGGSTGSIVSWISVSKAFDRLCFILSVLWNIGLIVGLALAFQQ